MKNFSRIGIGAILAAGLFITAALSAQTVTKELKVEPFSKLLLTGNANVELRQGTPASLYVEAPESEQEMVTATTIKEGDVLKVHSKGSTEAVIKITVPELSVLTLQDASSLTGKGVFRQENMKLEVKGATSVKMEVEVSQIDLEVSGAGVAEMRGAAEMMNLKMSGAAHARLDSLKITKAVVTASGASSGSINVTEKIEGKVTGASSLDMISEPLVNELSVSSLANGVKIEIEAEEPDIQIDDLFDEIKKTKKGKKKFNGHFRGVELGVNTYVTRDRMFSLPPESEYLELKIPNSLTVNLNLIEASLPLIRQNFGLVTGLGIEFNNYKFEESFYLIKDKGKVQYEPSNIQFEKNKLSCSYLKAPFMFEFQINKNSMAKKFHIAAGGSFGLLLRSHTKYKYEQDGKTVKEKEWDRFYLNKYRAAGVVRLGWGPLNFFAEYNFLTLFEKNRGPELYPVSFGIALSYWE